MHRACILLLEDSEIEMKVFQSELKKYIDSKDIAHFAKRGQEAIDVIERQPPSDRPCIFILDINMPGELNGFDVLRWIRAHDEYKQCAIIILTSSDDPEHEKLAFELGATRFCTKPRIKAQTGALIKRILDDFRGVAIHE